SPPKSHHSTPNPTPNQPALTASTDEDNESIDTWEIIKDIGIGIVLYVSLYKMVQNLGTQKRWIYSSERYDTSPTQEEAYSYLQYGHGHGNSIKRLWLLEEYQAPEKPLSVENEITLYIKTMTGKTITMSWGKNETVLELKQKIRDKEDWDTTDFGLVYRGKKLINEITLKEYGFQNETRLLVIFNFN
ncbi:MAG: ubiquitin-like domain-containing protein, partial [Cytophagales bacterium]